MTSVPEITTPASAAWALRAGRRAVELGVLSLVLLTLLARPAGAQETVAYMGLRAAPGVASPWLLAESNRMLSGALQGVPGTRLLSPSDLYRAAGSPQALESCVQDPCMAVLAQAAGATQVVWGLVDRPTPSGYRVSLRSLRVPAAQPLGQVQSGCDPCEEGLVLAGLASVDLRGLRLGAAPAAPSPAAATPGIQHIPGVHRRLTAEEARRAGWLTLFTQPAGATLSLFTYSAGKTPVVRMGLLPGAYRATLSLEGYQDMPMTLMVYAGRETRHMLQLAPSGVMLRVVSMPLDAEVLIDGRIVGRTPLAAPVLPLGPHELVVRAPGHVPVRRPVQGGPGRAVEIEVTLQKAGPTEGRLTVTTRPTRAALQIDGEPVGQSPLRRHLTAAGEHTVTAYLPGYDELRKTVVVTGGEELKLELALERAVADEGTLTVTSTPAGAKALLGKLGIGTTPINTIRFKPGRYILRLVKPGYPPYEVPVAVERGGHTTHAADLAAGPPRRDGLLLDATRP